MRLSLMKAAHVDLGGTPWQEIRVAHRFRPTYALANMGHPSDFLHDCILMASGSRLKDVALTERTEGGCSLTMASMAPTPGT